MAASPRHLSGPVQFAASHRVTSAADPSFIEVEGHRTAAAGGTEDTTRGRTR